MKIHFFQHVPFEGLGIIEDWIHVKGYELTATRFFNGEKMPSPESFDWLIIIGGTMNVYDKAAYPWLVDEKRLIEEAISTDKIVLGICLGAQLIADVLGSRIYANRYKEIGWHNISMSERSSSFDMFREFPNKLEVFHWHGDTFDMPVGAVHIAESEACRNQAFIYDNRIVGLQFHLESTRDSVEKLISNSTNEIVEEPYIQSPDSMLSDNNRFVKINKMMKSLLNGLERVYSNIKS